jgi:hypothetical protein
MQTDTEWVDQRRYTVAVRLNGEEMAALRRLAKNERLPVATRSPWSIMARSEDTSEAAIVRRLIRADGPTPRTVARDS